MSTVDITQLFPSNAEPLGEYYLITDDVDDPGPGQVTLKEFEPKVMRIKSGPKEPIRLSLRMQYSEGKWTLVLSWATKIYACHRMDQEVKGNTIFFHGEVMAGGKKGPGTFKFTQAEDKKSMLISFEGGFGLLTGVEWTLQADEPEWDEYDDYED